MPLPIQRHTPPAHALHNTMSTNPQQPQHMAHNMHTIPYLQNCLKYMHQAMFCPPITTLITAANAGFLHGFPFITQDLISKHLINPPATAKRCMKKAKAGIRSTRPQTQQDSLRPPSASSPPLRVEVHSIFCYAALADKTQGTRYLHGLHGRFAHQIY